ncbi:helix-turn-helix transcriptional regulator [Actinosynnema sp. NPDC051121]
MTGTGDQTPHSSDVDPPEGRRTLRSRLLGGELRRLREAAGLTVEDAAARTGQSPDALRRAENGITDAPAPEPAVWCSWDSEATSMIKVLCRAATQVDIFAPLGIHPALAPLDSDHCTAYVLDGITVDRRDMAVRVIRHKAGVYPGIGYDPLTRFSLPDGPAVILYAHLHAAHFTEEPEHLLGAYTLFEQLTEFTDTRNPT